METRTPLRRPFSAASDANPAPIANSRPRQNLRRHKPTQQHLQQVSATPRSRQRLTRTMHLPELRMAQELNESRRQSVDARSIGETELKSFVRHRDIRMI